MQLNRKDYADPCGPCKCNSCKESVENVYSRAGEMQTPCFSCDECAIYDGDSRKSRKCITDCGNYGIDNFHAKKLRDKFEVKNGRRDIVTKDTAHITNDIAQSENENVRIEYYTVPSWTKKNETKEISMCPGDLMIICNVLHDYANLLMECLNSKADEEAIAGNFYLYEYHAKRCKKIQNKIESAMNYSTAAAIEKCRKKQGKKSKGDDVGEDALVLALKCRREQLDKKSSEAAKMESSTEKKEDVDGQMSLFDY